MTQIQKGAAYLCDTDGHSPFWKVLLIPLLNKLILFDDPSRTRPGL
jgi:hypothetical protein